MRRLRVRNVQHYAVGRGGFVFPARQESEVVTRTRQQYREIKACVYLKLLEDVDLDDVAALEPAVAATEELGGVEPESPRAEAPETVPELPPHATKDAEPDSDAESDRQLAVELGLHHWMVSVFGLGEPQALALWVAGYQDAGTLMSAQRQDVLAVSGVGEATWQQIADWQVKYAEAEADTEDLELEIEDTDGEAG